MALARAHTGAGGLAIALAQRGLELTDLIAKALAIKPRLWFSGWLLPPGFSTRFERGDSVRGLLNVQIGQLVTRKALAGILY